MHKSTYILYMYVIILHTGRHNIIILQTMYVYNLQSLSNH